MSPYTILQVPIDSIENVLKAIYLLENIPKNLELDFKDQLSEAEIIELNQSIELVKTIVSEKFPSINPDEFVNFLISSSIKSNKMNFNNLIKTFNSLYSPEKPKEYKQDFAFMGFEVTAAEPLKVNKQSFYKILIKTFQIAAFLLAQYQAMQTTEQNNLIIEQNNRIENLLQQHIIECNEHEVEKNPYIIEIQKDISPGSRT